MKITFSVSTGEHSTTLTAIPGEIDGFPAIERLEFSAIPSSVSSDRVAVAGILAFGPYISGQVQFEEKISALTAEIIARYMNPRWVHVTPLHPSNLPIPRGSQPIVIQNKISPSPTDRQLVIVRNDRYEGSVIGMETSVIPSNAWLIDKLNGINQSSRFSSELAVAVLMAESLNISVIKMPSNDGLEPKRLHLLKQLLGAVGLGFETK